MTTLLDAPAPAAATWERTAPDAMEIIARLAGGTTFRDPTSGRSSREGALDTPTIAAALGFVRDPLAQRMALAVACQTTNEWPHVQAMAYPLLRGRLMADRAYRPLLVGHRRWRLRLVLCDAFIACCGARDATSLAGMARTARMRVEDYTALRRACEDFLMDAAREGAREAWQRLFG